MPPFEDAEDYGTSLLDSHDGVRPLGTINCNVINSDGDISGVTTTSGTRVEDPRPGRRLSHRGGGAVRRQRCRRVRVHRTGRGRDQDVRLPLGDRIDAGGDESPVDACLEALRRVVTFTTEARLRDPEGTSQFRRELLRGEQERGIRRCGHLCGGSLCCLRRWRGPSRGLGLPVRTKELSAQMTDAPQSATGERKQKQLPPPIGFGYDELSWPWSRRWSVFTAPGGRCPPRWAGSSRRSAFREEPDGTSTVLFECKTSALRFQLPLRISTWRERRKVRLQSDEGLDPLCPRGETRPVAGPSRQGFLLPAVQHHVRESSVAAPLGPALAATHSPRSARDQLDAAAP